MPPPPDFSADSDGDHATTGAPGLGLRSPRNQRILNSPIRDRAPGIGICGPRSAQQRARRGRNPPPILPRLGGSRPQV